MREFNIHVIYLHYCDKSNIIWVVVLNLRILPVTSQPRNQAMPLQEGDTEVSILNGPALLRGLHINAKRMPMIVYYINE